MREDRGGGRERERERERRDDDRGNVKICVCITCANVVNVCDIPCIVLLLHFCIIRCNNPRDNNIIINYYLP